MRLASSHCRSCAPPPPAPCAADPHGHGARERKWAVPLGAQPRPADHGTVQRGWHARRRPAIKYVTGCRPLLTDVCAFGSFSVTNARHVQCWWLNIRLWVDGAGLRVLEVRGRVNSVCKVTGSAAFAFFPISWGFVLRSACLHPLLCAGESEGRSDGRGDSRGGRRDDGRGTGSGGAGAGAGSAAASGTCAQGLAFQGL